MPGAEVELVRGGRGDFIVVADGETLWDKKKMGGFPDDSALAAQLSRR